MDLQEALTDTGVMIHCSTGQHCCTNMIAWGYHKIQHPDKPKAVWNRVPWSDEVKVELFGHSHQKFVWIKKEQHLIKWTPCQIYYHWGCMAARDTGIIVWVEGRTDCCKHLHILKNQLTHSVRKNWSWKGIGFYSRWMNKNILQNSPWTTSSDARWSFWPTQSLDLKSVKL